MTTYNAGDKVKCISLGRKNNLADVLEIGAIYTVVRYYPEIKQGEFHSLGSFDLRNDKGEEGNFSSKDFEPA